MPRERESITHKFSIAGHEGYITAGKYEDGTVGEIFLTDIGKEGSTLRGMMNAFATAISIGLQYGVPLETLVRKFSYMRFDPEGITGNPEIPFAKSMPDYLMRWLASRFIDDLDVLEDLGILTPEVRARRDAQQTLLLDDGPERPGTAPPRATAPTAPRGRPALAESAPPDGGAHRHAAGDPGPAAGPRAGPRLRAVRRHDAAHRLLLHLLELRQQHRLRVGGGRGLPLLGGARDHATARRAPCRRGHLGWRGSPRRAAATRAAFPESCPLPARVAPGVVSSPAQVPWRPVGVSVSMASAGAAGSWRGPPKGA